MMPTRLRAASAWRPARTVALLLCAATMPARAASPVQTGPVPAWVRPMSIPAPATKASNTAVQLLLVDHQLRVTQPAQTEFHEMAFLIQNAQGLDTGNIRITWWPDRGPLTLHRLAIHRGDRVIDVLGNGDRVTVARREENLGGATLDGSLTASLQPEGLQVGDTVDIAYSVETRDPLFADSPENVIYLPRDVPVQRDHVLIQWPAQSAIQLRPKALPAPFVVRRAGDVMTGEFSADDVAAVPAPRAAPPRFLPRRYIQMSSYRSWEEVSAAVAPLYDRATAIPSNDPLAAEVARIAASSADDASRALAALRLVEEKVRYVALLMGTGGLVPAPAATTWANRYGDCKAKTALLIALLHALHIEAVPVLVNTKYGDSLSEQLPRIGVFNHVIVRATIGGQQYWLDGTRAGDTNLEQLPIPFYRWVLPVLPRAAALTYLAPPVAERPLTETDITIDARAGLLVPTKTKVTIRMRGDAALAYKNAMTGLSEKQQSDAIAAAVKDYLEHPTLTRASFDDRAGEERIEAEGPLTLDWFDRRYYIDAASIGGNVDLSRDPGPDQNAPVGTIFPWYELRRVTILKPAGAYTARIDTSADVDEVFAGYHYWRKVTSRDHTLIVETSTQSLVSEFPAEEAPAAQKKLKDLGNTHVVLPWPKVYDMTDADYQESFLRIPETAQEWIERAYESNRRNEFAAAIKDLAHALTLDPNDVRALCYRVTSFIGLRDYASAERDLKAATAITPHAFGVARARGALAMAKGDYAGAVAADTEALTQVPGDAYMLLHRAGAYSRMGDIRDALADTEAGIAQRPRLVDLYLLRADLFIRQKKQADAYQVALALQKAAPDDDYAQVVAGDIFATIGKRAEAMDAFDLALRIRQAPYIFLNRFQHREAEDRSGRLADLNAALKLDADYMPARVARADMLFAAADYAGAVEDYTALIGKQTRQIDVLSKRGIAYAKLGKKKEAESDFSAARSRAEAPVDFNNLCWDKATAGVALTTALEECDIAVEREPKSPNASDSRGFVLLRLGRLDESISSYDKALELQPGSAVSLHGRSIAWFRKGDKVRADADEAAALRADPGVAGRFASWGVTRN